jgi:hypothetical protein
MNLRNPESALRNLWIGAGVALALVLVSSCGGGGGGGGGGSTSSNPPPPPPTSFSYPISYYAYTAGPPVGDVPYQDSGNNLKPLQGPSGGTWTIKPALPPGLVFSQTDGSIGGQPTAASPATNYTVTSVSGGTTYVATLTIAVAAAPLMNLGLTSGVTSIQFANSNVLSVESKYQTSSGWILQNFASGATVAQGNGVGASTLYVTRWFTDLENDVMADLTPAGLEVRSATDGSVISNIPEPLTVYWYRLAKDGSYVAAGSPTALTVWSTSGEVLVSRAGNYGYGINAFAAPGQLLIANGPAGANVIETISVPTGTSSISPVFQGTFNTWFVDGQSFLTNLGNTVWVYSNAAAQQDFTSLPSLGDLAGQGNWFWAFNGDTLNIYKVGASTAPTLTATGYNAIPSGGTLGVLGGRQVTVIDLSGTTPTSTTYPVPYVPATYGAQSATEWMIGDGYGVLFDGTSIGSQPRTLTLGSAMAIAGGTSYFSVATASGTIYNYNSSDNSLVGTISFPAYGAVSSADGTVLAVVGIPASQTGETQTFNIYSVPSGTLISSSTFIEPNGLVDFAMTGSGNFMTETFLNPNGTNPCYLEVVPITGGGPIFCDDAGDTLGITLSPDGTLAAVNLTGADAPAATNIYKNGTLVTAVPGTPFVWLDNDRLLMDEGPTIENLQSEPDIFKIYDSSGNLLGNAATTFNLFSCGDGYSGTCQIVSTNSITQGTEIVNYLTGAITWASADYFKYGESAAAGAQIILAAGDYVLAEPFPTN